MISQSQYESINAFSKDKIMLTSSSSDDCYPTKTKAKIPASDMQHFSNFISTKSKFKTHGIDIQEQRKRHKRRR